MRGEQTGPGQPLRPPFQGLTYCALYFGKISLPSGSWNGMNKGARRQDECLGAAADVEGRRVALMNKVAAEMDRGGQVPGI